MKNCRYLLKLSGEVLKGNDKTSISWGEADAIARRLASLINKGTKMGIVIGGGNIFRGASGALEGYNRLIGDQIGMMATVINGLTLVERLKAQGVNAVLQSGIQIDGIADLFNADKAEDIFKTNGVVVFCGGIGNPYFSTDTTAVLRALQIKADFVLKATKVNGIYDCDPKKYPDAKKYESITFDQILEKKLGIMDLTAVLLMKNNGLKLNVFDMNEAHALEKAVSTGKIGTIVKE